MVLFLIFNKVILTLESVDEILKTIAIKMKAGERSVLLGAAVAVCYLFDKVILTFESVEVWPFKYILHSTNVVQGRSNFISIQSADVILKCGGKLLKAIEQ